MVDAASDTVATAVGFPSAGSRDGSVDASSATATAAAGAASSFDSAGGGAASGFDSAAAPMFCGTHFQSLGIVVRRGHPASYYVRTALKKLWNRLVVVARHDSL